MYYLVMCPHCEILHLGRFIEVSNHFSLFFDPYWQLQSDENMKQFSSLKQLKNESLIKLLFPEAFV